MQQNVQVSPTSINGKNFLDDYLELKITQIMEFTQTYQYFHKKQRHN